MGYNLDAAFAFGSFLRENQKAADFYDHCDPAQKQAILLKLSQVSDVRDFVSKLSHAVI